MIDEIGDLLAELHYHGMAAHALYNLLMIFVLMMIVVNNLLNNSERNLVTILSDTHTYSQGPCGTGFLMLLTKLDYSL